MPNLHALTLSDVLHRNALSYPQRPAVVCETHRFTYPQLEARVNKLANALAKEGVAQGERVLWIGQNCHRVLELLLACARLGAIFCPANWRQSPAELGFVIDDCDPQVVVWQEEEIGDTAKAAREQVKSNARWLEHNRGEYEELLASGSAEDPGVEVDPMSPVLMMYTAAFGGTPNGALLTHHGQIAQSIVMAGVQGVDSEYVYVNSGPLFHVATFMTTLATFLYGGNNVFMRRFDATNFCQVVEREGVTGAFLVGAMLQDVVDANKDRSYNLKTLRTIPAFAPKEWLEMTTPDDSPWALRPAGYGQTEVGGMATLNAIGDPGIGSHGRPSPVLQVSVVGPDDEELPAGEVGEIVVRGSTVMAGYWRRPELNAERQRNGWHHTSDLGRRESDGSLSFIGPKTRIIKSAAENIYPIEVESCIMKHPAVDDACVIGVPDPRWTQSVKAIVVLRDGMIATEQEIIDHCRTHIASYKKPRTVEFSDKALPRTQAGLHDRDAIDATYGGGGYPGSGS